MLMEQLQSDQVAALKKGDKLTLGVIRYIIAQIKYRQIEKRSELSDDEVVQVMRKQIKELTESADGAKKANRPDIVAKTERQMQIVRRYLPAELSNEALEAEIRKLAEENGEKISENPKAIIGIAMAALRSKADPGRIQAVLRKLQMM